MRVQITRQSLELLNQRMWDYGLLPLAIGIILFAVGGIELMNVMLMSVMEHRSEIGVRLPIDDRRQDIRIVFLIKTWSLAALGSLLGIACWTVDSWVSTATSNWPLAKATLALPFGASMALGVRLCFGIYMTPQATRLDPIAILRAE